MTPSLNIWITVLAMSTVTYRKFFIGHEQLIIVSGGNFIITAMGCANNNIIIISIAF